MINRYIDDHFKDKDLYFKDYLQIGFNTYLSMFDMTLSDGIDPITLQLLNVTCGSIVVGLTSDGDLSFGTSIFSGDIDKNGRGSVISGITLNGKDLHDCVVIWNNYTHTPDCEFMHYARQLAEIDVSEDFAVLNTRIKKVPTASNEKAKKALDITYKKLIDGAKDLTVLDPTQLFSETGKLETIDLTEPELAEKLKVLADYHDSICRRAYGLLGLSLHSPMKQAQQTIEELEGSNDVSMIIPVMKYNLYKEAFEEINSKFGVNWSIDFAEPYKHKYEIMQRETADLLSDEGGEDNADIQTDDEQD